ncbi:MAG: MBL fold metallo-hydrolase [[Clostridium] leptum]
MACFYARQRQQREQYLYWQRRWRRTDRRGHQLPWNFAALETREIDRESIGAVFITHEHTDHIKGLKVLLKTAGPRVCN